MNETNKTLTFLGVAAAACIAAYISQPRSADIDVERDVVGQQLTKAFDVEKADRMKITRFDEDSAALSTFEVAQTGRLWTIPSKGGYPADAQSQMAEAVTGVLDREILSVVTSNPADHPQYGVVDPESPKLDVGQTGVGTRVTVTGDDGPLVDLIIGHEVKDSDGQHYVRRANQDFVYVVKINPEDFSTTFEDWIEDDLLKISPWDIQQVELNDYTAEMFMTPQGLGVDTNYKTDMTLRYDDAKSEWRPVTLRQATDARRGEFEEFTLAEDQELNADKLSDLKNALDDLKIVDVSKKPKGLSANLKAGEDFMRDNEALLSLIQRGFAPVGSQAGAADLLASSGEVICTMKDGVEYVLRFGNPQVEAGAAPEQAEEADGKAVNRYLFVMARFNEDAIKKPELEDVPPLPEGAQDEGARDDDAEQAAEDDTENDTEETPADDASQEQADNEEAADDSEQESTEDLIAKRKQIEQRNQRKLDEYADQIKEGKEKVNTLNERFGDWYYVIANDVYNKIHLGRDDVIQAKEAEEGEGDDEEAAGPLGAGGAIPGMPNFSGLGAPPAEEPSAEAPVADEPADEPAADDEAGDAEMTDDAAMSEEQAPAADEPVDEASPEGEADQ